MAYSDLSIFSVDDHVDLVGDLGNFLSELDNFAVSLF